MTIRYLIFLLAEFPLQGSSHTSKGEACSGIIGILLKKKSVFETICHKIQPCYGHTVMFFYFTFLPKIQAHARKNKIK